jgi:hypothetical protein
VKSLKILYIYIYIDKLLLPPFVLLLPPPLPSSSSSGMRNLDGWMDDEMDDKWMGRMTTTGQTKNII